MQNIEAMEDNLLGDSFSNFLKEHIASQESDKEEELDEEMDMILNTDRTQEVVFRLDDFETLIELAKQVKLQNVLTYVYQFKEDYYLSVTFFTEDSGEAQIKNDLSQLYEYAHRTNVTMDILEEYGELVMERNALELTRYYFK